MDTPQYGETLKFVYTKYQPIFLIELVILKKGNIQILQGVGVEPRPPVSQAGMKTTTQPVSWLGGVEISENIKCYPHYFIRANRVRRLTKALCRLTGVK